MSFNSGEMVDIAEAVSETKLTTKPSEVRPDRPRRHSRYPIELDLQYRLIVKGRVQHLGQGRTLNISSGGVLFAPHDIQKLGCLQSRPARAGLAFAASESVPFETGGMGGNRSPGRRKASRENEPV